MKGSAKNRAIGFYMQAMAAITGFLSVFVYFFYVSALGKIDKLVIAGLVIGFLCGAVQLFVKTGIFALMMSILFSVTLFYFITCTETIGSYTDYFNNIVAFGHPELIGIINLVIGFIAVSAVIAIIGCFFTTKKEEPEAEKI